MMNEKTKIILSTEHLIGKTQNDLIQELVLNRGDKMPKNIRSRIAKAIFKNIDERLLNTISIRTISVKNNNSPKESLPLAQIVYTEIIHENWEDSKLFKTLNTDFIFLIFSDKLKNDKNPYLKDIILWKMNKSDLAIVKMFWELSKENICEGDYKNFISIKSNFICHVRTKGANKNDLMKTPQHTKEVKRAFWLNASYLKSKIL